ncbi:MAG: SpoIIE family protein phosphatase [Nannocystaceae bacterium]
MKLKLEIVTCVRAMPGEHVSGDCVGEWHRDGVALIALIDGLGHGPEAEASARAAHDYIDAHPGDRLEELIEGCGQVLRPLRGAAITLVRIDCRTGVLSHIGIGNVEVRYRGNGNVQALTTPGIVGSRVRRIVARDFLMVPGDLLIMHTDGISSRFDIMRLYRKSADAILKTLLAEHAKSHDDAGCVVITCAHGDPDRARS